MRQGFIAEGTTCKSCEKIIKRQAKKVCGVKDVTFDYATETGYVTFDEDTTNIDEILYKIEDKGYTCFIMDDSEPTQGRFSVISNTNIAWAMIIVGIIIAGYFVLQFVEGINMPRITESMSYGLIFVVGLLTGFHCIGMCGGFVVGYTTKCANENKKPHKAHLMYAGGKTISYTIIGALFGLVGSIIAFTPTMRGIAGILAGLFLVLYGLKMFNVFPALRKINIKTPKFVYRFVGKESKKHSSPLVIGLLNGLMIACGPLQAMYIMAAGTGSMIEGAKTLLIFGLGTLPVMMAFGYMVSLVSNKITHKIVKFSGAFVIVLGLLMLNNGLVLTGTGYDAQSLFSSVSGTGFAVAARDSPQEESGITLVDGYQEIRMDVTRYGWEPSTFVLQKDVPVKWIINGKEINGCNNAIQVPSYGLNFDINPGEQIIEFTPDEAGTIRWSCWMGMIPGTFIVKEDTADLDAMSIKDEIDAVPKQKSGSCGMGGGCGCAGV